MPMFGLRSPDSYPHAFHVALVRGVSECLGKESQSASIPLLAPFPILREAQVEQKRFNSFKMNLRRHPLHKLNATMNKAAVRCAIIESAAGFQLTLKFKSTRKVLGTLAESLGW